MFRIDTFPTDKYGEFDIRPGKPMPFGATLVPGGVNFSVYSSYARYCELVLFKKREKEPFAVIPFPDSYRIGNVFTMVVFDLDFENIEYGYRMDGPFSFRDGHWFDKQKILMDPYAKAVGGRDVWGEEPDWNDPFQFRSRIILDDFDWEGDKPLELSMRDLIIYEMHVRGFTKHASSGVKYPGTFSAIREKIPYLKDLGVNCVELMPVYEFDEFENSKVVNGEKLMNYWGYSTVGFFAPKSGYAATGKYGMQVDEFKTLVKELHKNGLEVILDVVFNHTAEGNENGRYISFRGIDNKTYYMLTPEGYYFNFSGCGNTLNCNNPIVRNMILDCLRYWASEYHIDGFRFDLATILGRNQDGSPMHNPPLLETLAFDPVLGKVKLIAEAWDAGGLYQVGSFPSWGRWAEWNGKFRDDVRKFIKGDMGVVGGLAQRIQGSPDLYDSYYRGTCASINFVTCHDGFTLMDMVSYDGKHNDANGEGNGDGNNDNDSWNCGWEGQTDDEGINFLRKKQIKNAICLLLLSHGVPMLLSGDEFGNTQFGNNNAYCQDNLISWLNWGLLNENQDVYNFAKNMIAFRKAHPILKSRDYAIDDRPGQSGYPEISWHGTKAWDADWSETSRCIAVMFNGRNPSESGEDDFIYAAFNSHWEPHDFQPPELPQGMTWCIFANTDMSFGNDICEPENEKSLENPYSIIVGPRSTVILKAKKIN